MSKVYGDRLPPGTVGPRQVPQVPASRLAQPPIQVRRWVRNADKHPNAAYESSKNEALNQAALFRTKSYCTFVGDSSLPTSTPWDLWRFAFRSGPLAHSAICSVVMSIPTSSFGPVSSYANLNLYTSNTEAAVISATPFEYGTRNSTSSGVAGWKYVRVIEKFIDITPNTDYYALVTLVQGVRVFSVCMFELASMTENFDGYLPQNISVQNPVLDLYRRNQSDLIQTLWPDCGPNTFTWSTRPGAGWSTGNSPGPAQTYKETSSATGVNILTTGNFGANTTTVSANTPGWSPDMTLKNRASQPSGVPCVMKAFGAMAALTGGTIELKDSTGTVIASISNVWTATPSWQSVTFNLPATSAKYDVHYSTPVGSGTFKLWAVSIYEKG